MTQRRHTLRLTLITLLAVAAMSCKDTPASEQITPDDQERSVTPRLALNCDGAAPDTPPVQQSWLPAVSVDGRQIAAAVSTEDGGRGHANFKLMVLDVEDGSVAHEQVIIDPADDWSCGAEANAGVKKRIDDANAWLDARAWNPMMHLHAPDGIGRAWSPGDDGPVVAWDPPDLTVYALRLGHLMRGEQAFPGWLPTTGRLDPDDGELCHQPSYLGDAWMNTARRAVLVRLYFTGNDMCWEHDSRFYAYSLADTAAPGTVCSAIGGQCAPVCTAGDASPQDDACKAAGGVCCVPKSAVVPCTRLGGTCAAECPLNTPPSSQPGCAPGSVCCLGDGGDVDAPGEGEPSAPE